MTRQTDQPVERLNLQASNRLVQELVHHLADGRITVDLPYQRGPVWTLDQRIALVKSWLAGTPIPAIIANDRMNLEWEKRHGQFTAGKALWAIIDGRQRIETAAAWLGSEFAVPASWFPADSVEITEDTPDGLYVRFSGLTETARRIFENRCALPVALGSVGSVEEEAEIYLRVNGGGTLQTGDDMARAEQIARV